jgi:hypothetical protein
MMNLLLSSEVKFLTDASPFTTPGNTASLLYSLSCPECSRAHPTLCSDPSHNTEPEMSRLHLLGALSWSFSEQRCPREAREMSQEPYLWGAAVAEVATLYSAWQHPWILIRTIPCRHTNFSTVLLAIAQITYNQPLSV